MFADMLNENITFGHKGAEVDGVAPAPTLTARKGAFFALTLRQREAIEGPVQNGAGTAHFAYAGFGTTWNVAVGDTMTCRGSVLKVYSVTEVKNPRSLVGHHVTVLGV